MEKELRPLKIESTERRGLSRNRFNRVFFEYKSKGGPLSFDELAKTIFPGVTPNKAVTNLTNIIRTGVSVKYEVLFSLCDVLGCTPNDLFVEDFGYTTMVSTKKEDEYLVGNTHKVAIVNFEHNNLIVLDKDDNTVVKFIDIGSISAKELFAILVLYQCVNQ